MRKLWRLLFPVRVHVREVASGHPFQLVNWRGDVLAVNQRGAVYQITERNEQVIFNYLGHLDQYR